MAIWIILIFIVPLLVGLLAFRFADVLIHNLLHDLFMLGGAFLFAITMLHLLPEVFHDNPSIGIWLLMGFFIQVIIEVLFGSEHETSNIQKINPIPFILAIFFHAFAEGSALSFSETTPIDMSHHGNHSHAHNNFVLLFLGIMIHKIPIALIVVIICVSRYKKKLWAVLGLLITVSATPLGLLAYSYLSKNQIIIESTGSILLALVSGSFLHVASFLFFSAMHENTAQKYRRLTFIGIGTLLGIISELCF